MDLSTNNQFNRLLVTSYDPETNTFNLTTVVDIYRGLSLNSLFIAARRYSFFTVSSHPWPPASNSGP